MPFPPCYIYIYDCNRIMTTRQCQDHVCIPFPGYVNVFHGISRDGQGINFTAINSSIPPAAQQPITITNQKKNQERKKNNETAVKQYKKTACHQSFKLSNLAPPPVVAYTDTAKRKKAKCCNLMGQSTCLPSPPISLTTC